MDAVSCLTLAQRLFNMFCQHLFPNPWASVCQRRKITTFFYTMNNFFENFFEIFKKIDLRL